MANKILIVAAHPDDDILGLGGTISKLVRSGLKVSVAFIAEGSSCRFEDFQSQEAIETIKFRNQCGREALSVLGVNDIAFFDLPCGRLDQTPIIEINKRIEGLLKKIKPEVIYTHFPFDVNNDHRIVSRAVEMATRPSAFNQIEKLFYFETLSSTEWTLSGRNFSPNYFEVLSEEDIELKWKSMEKYITETSEYPGSRSKHGLKTLANYRGLQIGNVYAEAFELIRQVNR